MGSTILKSNISWDIYIYNYICVYIILYIYITADCPTQYKEYDHPKKKRGISDKPSGFLETVIVLQLLENCETKLVGGLEHLLLK